MSEQNVKFEQCITTTRPHTLLTQNARFSGDLVYRYDDTGEKVSVPNIWYNQTFETRVHAMCYEADRQDGFADRMQASPPHNRSPAAVADIVRRYRERAQRIRAEADRINAAGLATHPVAASLLPVDFGPPVGIA